MSEEITAVCTGEGCIDTYLPPVGRQFAGGNAVNSAVALRRAGAGAAFLGTVGSDQAGQAVLAALRAYGVDTTHALIQEGATHRAHVRPLPGGGVTFAHELNAQRREFALTEEMARLARGARLAHTNWLWQGLDGLGRLRGGRALISVDFGHLGRGEGVERHLAACDTAFFTLPAEQSEAAQDLAEWAASRGTREVIVLMGVMGSLAYTRGQTEIHPAVPARLVDTLGAGDAYIGTYLAGLLRGEPVYPRMRAAAEAAARTCEHYGAFPGAEI